MPPASRASGMREMIVARRASVVAQNPAYSCCKTGRFLTTRERPTFVWRWKGLSARFAPMSRHSATALSETSSMSQSNIPPSETFRLQALARTLSVNLWIKFGQKEYFTPDEVESICQSCMVPIPSRHFAVAMFVEPTQAKVILEAMEPKEGLQELRLLLAARMSLPTKALICKDGSNMFHFHPSAPNRSGSSSGIDGWGWAATCGGTE